MEGWGGPATSAPYQGEQKVPLKILMLLLKSALREQKIAPKAEKVPQNALFNIKKCPSKRTPLPFGPLVLYKCRACLFDQ